MAFHLFGIFLFNQLLLLIYTKGWVTGFPGGFDPEQFAANVLYYNYSENNPQILILYFVAGMGFSLALAGLIRFIEKQIRNAKERHRKAV